MYLPDYQTIKFEQQERIDKAANAHVARRRTSQSRAVKRRTLRAVVERRGRRARRRAHPRWRLAMLRRLRST